MLLSLFLTTVAFAGAMPDRATFLCEDSAGVKYGVDLGKIKKTLTIEPRDGTARSVTLSDPNAGIAGGGYGKSMVYDQWVKGGADLYERLDPSVELVTRYEGNAIELHLYVDHKRPAGLRCRSGKYAATVVTPELSIDRLAEPVLDAADERDADGQLKPVAVIRWGAFLRRLAIFQQSVDGSRLQDAAHFVGPALLAVDSTSIGRIAQRLEMAESPLWQELLRVVKYREFEKIDRYVSWAKSSLLRKDREGARKPDAEGFKIAVKHVLKTKKEWRDRFLRDIAEPMGTLASAERKKVFAVLSTEQKAFLQEPASPPKM